MHDRWRYLRPSDETRAMLAEAIFSVEDEIESRGNGHPYDPTVVSLRGIRNKIYDELGINERRG